MYKVSDARAIATDFSQAASHYNDYAAVQRVAARQVAHRLAALEMPRDALLLDAGSGTGLVVASLPSVAQGYRWIGLDIAPAMLATGHRFYSHSLCADMQSLPLASESVEAVTSSLAMQWLGNPRHFLAEAYRVATPEASLIVTTLISGTLMSLSRSFDSLGRPAPILSFEATPAILDALVQTGWQMEDCCVTSHRSLHPHLRDVLNTIKYIGARHKSVRGSIRHRGDLAALEVAYRHLQQREESAIPIEAEWEILCVTAQKRG